MTQALTGVAANLLVGDDGPKRLVLQHWLRSKPAGEPWAVLDNAGVTASSDWQAVADVSMRRVGDGCLCCNAVTLRVELTQLLRQARPRRVLLLPSAAARLSELLKLLSDRWLSPVLDLRASIGVVAVEHSDSLNRESAESGWLAQAGIIGVETGEGSQADALRARDHIAAAAPQARVLVIHQGAMDTRLLDEPGPRRAARFHSG